MIKKEKKNILFSFFWTFLQQFGVQIINLVVQILIANQVGPAAVGAIAILNVFIVVMNDLVDGGMSSSLIRSSQPDQRDYSTVFYTNVMVSVAMYILLFISAPFIAEYYDLPVLKNVLRILGLSVVFQSFLIIQRTRLTKELKFKTQTIIAIPATLLGGLLGLVLAYKGFGIWSLVYLALSKILIEVLLYNVIVRWRPILYFNKKRFFYHFNYGYKLTISGILNNVFNNIYSLIIGKSIGMISLGLYDKSMQLRQVLLQNISTALNKVTFPLFAQMKSDKLRLKIFFQKLMIIVFAITTFILLLLELNAESIFGILFSPEWAGAVPYFKLICIAGLLYPIHSYNLNILKIYGKSGLFLKLEVLKKIVVLLNIIIGIQFGIFGLLYGMIIGTVIGFFINSYYTGKEIGYSSTQQIMDMLPIVIIAVISYFITFAVKYFVIEIYDWSDILNSITISSIFMCTYLINIWIFQNKNIKFLLNNLKP